MAYLFLTTFYCSFPSCSFDRWEQGTTPVNPRLSPSQADTGATNTLSSRFGFVRQIAFGKKKESGEAQPLSQH